MVPIIVFSHLTPFTVQDCVSVFWNFKNFSSYRDKTLPLLITKALFGDFGCKIQQSSLSKKCTIKHNTSDLELRKGNTGGPKTRHSFSLFICNYQIKVKQRFREFNKLLVIYKFIGLHHEITEICSINWKHCSNWTDNLNTYVAIVSNISNTKISLLGYGLLGMTRTSKLLINTLKKQQFKVMIIDESHYLKNRLADRTKNLYPLAKDANRVILLSGTPSLARPEEVRFIKKQS